MRRAEADRLRSSAFHHDTLYPPPFGGNRDKSWGRGGAFHCETRAFHCDPRAFHCETRAFHCDSIAIQCVSRAFHCDSRAFQCDSKEPFHCDSRAFHCDSRARKAGILRQGQDFQDYEAQMKWQWEVERVKTIFTYSMVFYMYWLKFEYSVAVCRRSSDCDDKNY